MYVIQKKALYPIFASCWRLMRLHHPVGSLLLLSPTLIALWLAAHEQGHWPAPSFIVIFAVGVFVMRSAGCVMNDWADRHFDGAVQRTKHRPLVTGAIAPRQALWLFWSLIGVAFCLVCMTNKTTVGLSVVGAGLAITYPFTKRWTYFPQVWLGAAFSWGIPMAYSAQAQSLSWACWLLFLGNVFWTIAYDTLYAMADRAEDLKIGVKSTAVWAREHAHAFIAAFQLAALLCFLLLGQWKRLQLGYYVGYTFAACLMLYQHWMIKDGEPVQYFKAFLNNQWVGAALFMGTLCGLPH